MYGCLQWVVTVCGSLQSACSRNEFLGFLRSQRRLAGQFCRWQKSMETYTAEKVLREELVERNGGDNKPGQRVAGGVAMQGGVVLAARE